MDRTPPAEGTPTEDEQFAAYMQQHFGVQVGPSDPGELDDDAQVDAYVSQHFAPTGE